jgi:hypothetical protein
MQPRQFQVHLISLRFDTKHCDFSFTLHLKILQIFSLEIVPPHLLGWFLVRGRPACNKTSVGNGQLVVVLAPWERAIKKIRSSRLRVAGLGAGSRPMRLLAANSPQMNIDGMQQENAASIHVADFFNEEKKIRSPAGSRELAHVNCCRPMAGSRRRVVDFVCHEAPDIALLVGVCCALRFRYCRPLAGRKRGA